MNHYQRYCMDGQEFPGGPFRVHSIVRELEVLRYELPHGLIGVDADNGLVKVQINPNKVQFMKLGRLLKNLEYSDQVIRESSCELTNLIRMMRGAGVQFTISPIAAYEVYLEGPSSCMVGNESVRVYSTEDVRVAFVEIEGRIVARSVVVINEDIGLQYVNAYGNEGIIIPMLEELGFESGNLMDCKLAYIEDSDGVQMCPYFDCGTEIDIGPDGMLVGVNHGEYQPQEESGRLGTLCVECHEIHRNDSTIFCEYLEGEICEGCTDEVHVFVNSTSYHKDSDEVQLLESGEYALATESINCEHSDEWHHEDSVTYCEYDSDNYLDSEVIQAVTDMDHIEDREACPRSRCVYIQNVWVHDDIAVDYEEYVNPELFELEG